MDNNLKVWIFLGCPPLNRRPFFFLIGASQAEDLFFLGGNEIQKFTSVPIWNIGHSKGKMHLTFKGKILPAQKRWLLRCRWRVICLTKIYGQHLPNHQSLSFCTLPKTYRLKPKNGRLKDFPFSFRGWNSVFHLCFWGDVSQNKIKPEDVPMLHASPNKTRDPYLTQNTTQQHHAPTNTVDASEILHQLIWSFIPWFTGFHPNIQNMWLALGFLPTINTHHPPTVHPIPSHPNHHQHPR